MAAVLGANTKIIRKNGSKVTVAELTGSGKTIGLYFSAHWCPPCRGFTPQLAQYYNKIKPAKGDQFEIIFVSCDRDQASFQDYFNSMPWLALDFSESAKKDELSEKFEINGIPSLIIIDGDTGAVKDGNGRDTVGSVKGGSYPGKW